MKIPLSSHYLHDAQAGRTDALQEWQDREVVVDEVMEDDLIARVKDS